MRKTYRFAEQNVRICTGSNELHQMCQSYLTDSSAQWTVQVSQQDIDFERFRADHPGYSDAYLETLAVYRKIAERMPVYDTFLFHGSAIAVDGAAYIFTAQSGTGKSTHARLWREMLIDRLKVKLYRLGCNMELEAAELSYQTMKG